VTRNPTKEIVNILTGILNNKDNDMLKCCLLIEEQLIQGLAEELREPDLTFEDKFQIIHDLKYVGNCLEDLIEMLQKNIDNLRDPCNFIMQFLEPEDD